MDEAGIVMASPLSLTSRTWFGSMNNFIPIPALASGIDPPSYVTLYPLSPAKTVSGIVRQRTMASNLFIEKLLLDLKSGALVYIHFALLQHAVKWLSSVA